MATASFDNHPALISHFNAAEQARLEQDDTDAFSLVTGILMVIVSGGLIFGIVSVMAIIAMS